MLRKGEAAILTWGNLTVQPDGDGVLSVLRSKTDEEGCGEQVYLGRQAVQALESIRPTTVDPNGFIFGLSGRRISIAARHAGLGEGYSGHSLRVGMLMDLARAGFPPDVLMTVARGVGINVRLSLADDFSRSRRRGQVVQQVG